jgi:ribA/ribD-fused uncharacterized protein
MMDFIMFENYDLNQDAILKFQGRYRFLSNFWLCKVRYRGFDYPSAEHAFQAQKTLRSGQRERFTDEKLTPGTAKAMGRAVTLRDDWEQVKVVEMYCVLQAKFFGNRKLLNKLLDTDQAFIVEGNDWGDTFWGQCPIGTGENMLGKLLMQLRAMEQHRLEDKL